MGMALRGVTHCYRCGTTLADNEFHTCKNCKRIEKEEEEKEMRDLGSLCDDYNERFNEEVENELNKKDARKMAKTFKKAGINMENKELEDLMRRIIQEELDKREKEDDEKDYDKILRRGRRMRDVNRIDKFLKELGDLWKEIPDWRFMQLICNLQKYIGNDGFYLEEDDVIKRLKEYIGK